MSVKIPFIVKTGADGKPSTLTVYIDGKPRVLVSSAPLFDLAFNAIKNGDSDALRRCFEVKKSIVEYGDGKFKLYEDSIYYNGVEIKNKMQERILAVYRLGFDLSPIVKFLDNLMQNPSKAAQEELYLFLEHNNLPITDDGYFLAYKYITNDYKDCHSRTFDYSIGTVAKMPRDKVDPDRHNTCSRGLHFCSRDYIGTGSRGDNRLVCVKINPRDVCAIPSDYNNSKGRCCEYIILEELNWNNNIQDNYRPSTPVITDDVEEEEELEDVDDTESNEDAKGGLTVDDVRNIRKALQNDNLTLTQIGKMYGVHRTTIQRIRDGISHTNVK